MFLGTTPDKAYVSFYTVKLTIAADIWVKNFGTSPEIANKMWLSARMLLEQVTWVPIKEKSGEAFIAPTDAVFHSCQSKNLKDIAQIRDMYGHNFWIAAFGHVEYSDLWNTQPPYITEFCYARRC